MNIPDSPDDQEVRALLDRVKRIAVVGLSPKAHRDSHRVSAYMQRAGYEIVPVYPREDVILGARVYRSVSEIEGPVDLVNVFRRAEELPEVAADILRSPHPNAPPVWFQLDCVNEEAIRALVEAGRTVIYDRCIMVEHRRLMGGGR
ncbi:MAG TPA: CoA-binding protein [Vicinamibacteria bacterium]|nr:CoA-binding protein [Vicinamibacteria bacterium]